MLFDVPHAPADKVTVKVTAFPGRGGGGYVTLFRYYSWNSPYIQYYYTKYYNNYHSALHKKNSVFGHPKNKCLDSFLLFTLFCYLSIPNPLPPTP